MPEQLPELDGPYEVLDLNDGDSLILHIKDWQIGTVVIHPRDKPSGKMVRALRVHLKEGTKLHFPYYWDLTSQRLIAQIEPFLLQPGYQDKVFTIIKHGVAPKARFTLEVRPV